MNRIYFKNGKRKVPYTFENLKIHGNLYKTDLIWFEGLNEWTKANEIDELKDFALSEAPLTNNEKTILAIKKSLKPSLILYSTFSICLGIFAGLLENYQYNDFIDKIEQNIRKLKDLDKYPPSNGEIPFIEIYVSRDDGTYFTRFSQVRPYIGTDQEQISYDFDHKFMFRPFKAIYKHANLSIEERGNIGLLLFNFITSSLVTSLLLFPIFLLGYFYKLR